MTVELFWLTLTALLAASLWVPFIAGMNAPAGRVHADFLRPPNLRALPAWMHRTHWAHWAHLNLLEQFLPFAVVVLVAHLAGVFPPRDGLGQRRLLLDPARPCGRHDLGCRTHALAPAAVHRRMGLRPRHGGGGSRGVTYRRPVRPCAPGPA